MTAHSDRFFIQNVISFDQRDRQALRPKDFFVGKMAKEIYRKAGEIVLIPFERIVSGSKRSGCDMLELEELASSIAENGLLDPIAVKPLGDTLFMIVAGERRFRACVILGMTEIPCILVNGDDAACAVFSLIDNLQHRRLFWSEEAALLQTLTENYGISLPELAAKIGKSVGYVEHKLRLLTLPLSIRERLAGLPLSEEYAKILLDVPEQRRESALKAAVERNFSPLELRNFLEEAEGKRRKRDNIIVFKDLTVFTNTVERAIETMRRAGIHATADKAETEEYVEYTVRIKKDNRAKALYQ